MLKLFNQLFKGEWFHFYDTPNRKLMKTHDTTYLSPEGFKSISPTVLIFGDSMESERPQKSIFDKTKGEKDGHPTTKR